MAAKLKATKPIGYDNVAFGYRYLTTKDNPLTLLQEYYTGTHRDGPGNWIWMKYGTTAIPNHCMQYIGRDYDSTYRILADEYYREKECEL